MRFRGDCKQHPKIKLGTVEHLPAPEKLTLRPTGFPSEMPARWGRVKNFRFYELQAAVPEDITGIPFP